MIVPFVGNSYESRSIDLSSQRCINFYKETVDNSEAKANSILISTQGNELYRDLSSITNGVCRGLITCDAKESELDASSTRTFGVYGNKLIEVGPDSITERATINNGATSVSMSDAGEYLMIADGVDLYSYDLTANTISTVSLPFLNPKKISYVGGHLVVINNDVTLDVIRNYTKFYWSELDDPNTFNALSWAQGAGNGQQLVSLASRGNEAWIFTNTDYAVWRESGNSLQPYSRMGGISGGIGCRAPDSAISFGDVVYWVGSSSVGNNQVFASNGYQAQRISTHAIEYQLSQIDGSTSDCISTGFQDEGHQFICFSFVLGNQTWVFDPAEGWHERASRDKNTNVLNRWKPIYSTFGNGEILMGSLDGPYVLRLGSDVLSEYDPDQGTIPLVSIRQSPVYWRDLKLMFHSSFILDMETGVGLLTGQGSDPQVALQFSDDGGHSWSNELWKPLGKQGKYKTRVEWRRLGRSRERVYRVTVSDPVKRIIMHADVKAIEGMK